MVDRAVRVGGRRYRLSDSRLSVLRYVADAGTVGSAQDVGLRSAAGTDRQAFLALAGLNADGMLRWALGGRDIRATALGRRVLATVRQPFPARRRGR
jgi:hypothetical protein